MVGLRQRQAADIAEDAADGATIEAAQRTRGGLKQRRMASDPPDAQPSSFIMSSLGPFGKSLIKDWGAGRKSAKQ
eukprot:2610331-Pyramimonas_sp.AAC.1